MTVAEAGDPRPPAKTQGPSAWSRSLNTSIAAISSGVAKPAVSSITETRYCISHHLLWLWAPVAGGRSHLLRTPPPRSDTASRISFEDCLVRRFQAIRHPDGFAGASPPLPHPRPAPT